MKQSAQPVQRSGGFRGGDGHQHAGDSGSGCYLDRGRKPFGFCINGLILGLGRRLDIGRLNRGKWFRSGWSRRRFRLRNLSLGLLDNSGQDAVLRRLWLSGRFRRRLDGQYRIWVLLDKRHRFRLWLGGRFRFRI